MERIEQGRLWRPGGTRFIPPSPSLVWKFRSADYFARTETNVLMFFHLNYLVITLALVCSAILVAMLIVLIARMSRPMLDAQ